MKTIKSFARRVTRRGGGLIPAFIFAFVLLCSVACSATRTITTSQTHMKNGDTVTVMTTKTIESYTATKAL